MNRRSFITKSSSLLAASLAAPMIVRADSLMPIRAWGESELTEESLQKSLISTRNARDGWGISPIQIIIPAAIVEYYGRDNLDAIVTHARQLKWI